MAARRTAFLCRIRFRPATTPPEQALRGRNVYPPCIETIDIGDRDDSVIGRFFPFRSRDVAVDLFQLLGKGELAAKRYVLETVKTDAGRYWRMR